MNNQSFAPERVTGWLRAAGGLHDQIKQDDERSAARKAEDRERTIANIVQALQLELCG